MERSLAMNLLGDLGHAVPGDDASHLNGDDLSPLLPQIEEDDEDEA